MSTQQRYFLRLAYNGTDYHGWQVQKNAKTIQEVLDHALSTLLRTKIETTGAGRTDTGVHAKEFFAHFDVEKKIENSKDFLYHLNCMLPPEIAVFELLPVKPEAHARFDATSRSYEYIISRTHDPFDLEFSFYMHLELDVAKMNEAAQYLLHVEDFSSFCKAKTQVYTKICKVTEAKWIEHNNKLTFYISADRFLRNMVRAIVGTHLEIGLGKVDIEAYKQIIERKDRSAAGYSVPPQGLFLTKIDYPKTIFEV